MTNDDKAPDSGREGDEVPAVLFWRWTKSDRELFARVKAAVKIRSSTDVLRFALGAAERELARSTEKP